MVLPLHLSGMKGSAAEGLLGYLHYFDFYSDKCVFLV